MAIAIFTRGKQAGRRLTLVQWPITIGRDPSATIPVDDPRTSRFHARIKKRDRLYVIEDLQSKNGTYLNGEKIQNAVINSGDKILIGDTEVVFLTPEAQINIHTELEEIERILGNSGNSSEFVTPIDISLTDEYDQQSFEPRRIESHLAVAPSQLDRKILECLFELQGNLHGHGDLSASISSLLKGLHTLHKDLSRSVAFLWTASARKLIPVSMRHTKDQQGFHFNKRALESVIARKQGAILIPNVTNQTSTSRIRVIIPVVHLGDILCVIHLEFDHPNSDLSDPQLAPLKYLIEQAAPSLDALLLRKDLENHSVGMIEAMIATLEAKDTYTHGHSERVSRYSMAIADEMNLDREVKRLLLMSSLCHDLGKIGIPDAILRKAALLNPDEYEEMKQHPVIGANIVAHLPNAKRFISGIKYHHEKWDGTGYPDGLAGEDIPFFGRIVAVADVFDAMVSGRSYSGFMEEREATERLSEDKDLFDPDIVRAFLRAWQSGKLTLKTSTQKNKIEDSAS